MKEVGNRTQIIIKPPTM